MLRGLSLLILGMSSLLAGCESSEEFPSHFPPSSRPDPTALSAPSVLDAFASTDPVYRMGPGDKLTIDVWGRPEISGPHVVGPDGCISIPMAGALTCSNRTREEVEQSVREMLQPFYKAVAVTVRVDDYASNRLSVLGSVRNPGSFAFTGRPTLLQALSLAGGVTQPANGLSAGRCSIIRGSTQLVWIDIAELLWHGNVGLNIPLQRDDVVYVPDGTGVSVYVLGQVKQPGVVRLTPGLQLVDAIALAGGLTPDALTDGIRVLRPTGSARADVDFDELEAGDLSLDLPLQEGDIIVVPTRKLEKWNYFWVKINPFAGFFTIQAE